MLRFVALICFVGISVFAAPQTIERLKVGSQIYTNVSVVSYSATDLYFRYEQGVKNVKFRNLEPEIQKLFDYDPQAASQAERKQAQDDARYQSSVGTKIAQGRPGQGAAGANDKRRSSEDNVADPISDHSPIGKPGPALAIEKWLGPAPVLKGKFVLVSFWTPWSIPCQKWNTQLSALQKKFPDKLQVVGLVPEADAELMSTDSKMDFPSAVDAKGKIQAAAGVSSVPYVVLMDPAGAVLYSGHPAALGEKELRGLLAKEPAPK